MQFYHVRNWEKFQHYKDRNPPWIKLHFELLSSEDWVCLNDSSRVLAIACMLVASRNSGLVPDDKNYFKRVAYLSKTPNFKPLIDCGFLELAQADASNTLANASTPLAHARPETYREKGEEERKKDSLSSLPFTPLPGEVTGEANPSPTEQADDSTTTKKESVKINEVQKPNGHDPSYHAMNFHPRYDEVRKWIVDRLPKLARQNSTEVNKWLLDGADPERDIFPSIEYAISVRQGDIGSFRYFTPMVASSLSVRMQDAKAADRMREFVKSCNEEKKP